MSEIERKDRDDEPTQVTALYNEVKKHVAAVGEILDDASDAAEEIERKARDSSQSVTIRARLSSRPPPPPVDDETEDLEETKP